MFLRRVLHLLTVFMSLTVTPLLIFILPSTMLYLGNQDDLGRQVAVLYPFVAMSAVMLLLGLALYSLSGYRPFRSLLWSYYVIGPIFFLFYVIHRMPVSFLDTLPFVLLILCLFLMVVTILTIKFDPRSAIKIFAILGLLFISNEVYQFCHKYNHRCTPIYARVVESDKVVRGADTLPNIYHIIFDEYQTDMFELTLSRDVKENLKNFVYFPENTTLFGRTAMSLASMFSSKSYNLKSPQGSYLWKAYNTDASMLYWLKKAGYSTYGYLWPVYTFPLSLFDVTIDFKEHARVTVTGQRAVFSSLWIYANLPYFMAEWLIDRDELDQLKNQNLVSGSANITSLVSFRNYLEDEKHFPGSNRYTFIHLLIPHFPYIFHCDCSYNNDLKVTSPIEQSKCATQLIVDFVKTLKELGRFDNSLILVCADHGGRFEIENGGLKGVEHLGLYSKRWSRARSNALLLIKPPGGNGESESLVVSHAESSILDIAPTIFASINYKTNMAFGGVSLLDFVISPLKRERYYYFFDKKWRDKWSGEGTDKMARFVIKDGQFSSPEYVKVFKMYTEKVSGVTYSLTGDIITSSDGKKYPLIKGALKGHLSKAEVHEDILTLAGWIFDVKNFQLPEAILVFDDEKFIFSGRMNVDRPDVVKVFPKFPLKTGFRFGLPLSLIQDLDNSKVHFFALLKSGEACKIYCPKGLEKGK